MSTLSKDFKVKNGLQVAEGGTFGAPVTVGTPTGPAHATTKSYVDGILLVPGPAGADAEFLVSETPPTTATDGQIWLDPSTASSYAYLDGFWIELSGPVGATGPQGEVGPTGPAGTSTGGSESLNLFLLMGA